MEGEFQFIERLKSLIPRSLQGEVPIGDDTAVLPFSKGKFLLFTTDAVVEGVDFLVGKRGAKPEAIGHKALAVNLSDMAAMGGRPLAFVATFGIPRSFSEAWVERAAKGILRLARQFKVQWVGGDISRAKQLFISIALIGEIKKEKVVLRKGAKAGNRIYVSGSLGGSIQGKHLFFTPRLREAQFLVRNFRPTSMIDISDGFIQDLEHLLKASGVGALIELDRIPISKAAQRPAAASRRKALQAALTDGEDFELLWTLPPHPAKRLEKIWPEYFQKSC